MKKPEILAPAGSMESLYGAVAAGCDAVYIGGSSFGARAYAENPSEEEMIEAIKYCHLHGVKLYMTVNTLFKEEERRGRLYDFLLPFYCAGLDAVIVQDMGVMDFVKEYFPELPVHASTQMALTMGRGADALKKYHVSRIVPARELSLAELRQMRRDTALELEVFVHGALCYCYSGQCLFSSMLGGRSGNRGRCAQPCRMPYRADGISGRKGNYLLSLKELCNLKYIGELIEAGIDSFKIEGRMKRPEYTAFVTSVYRKYTDLYCALGERGYHRHLEEHREEYQQDLRHLAELYNREGFTRGYLEGKAGKSQKRRCEVHGEMLSAVRPKHGGVLVGEVLSVGERELIYRASEDIFAQDVVEFRDALGGQIYEYTLGDDFLAGQRVTARYQRGSRIRPGDKVYRTRHSVLLVEIRREYLDGMIQQPVQGLFTAEEGKPMTLTVQLKDEVVCCQGEVCRLAKDRPSSPESVKKSLNQTGNSPFFFENLSLELEEKLFLNVGAVKRLRREVFGKLADQITNKYCRNTEKSYVCDRMIRSVNKSQKGQIKKAVSVMNLQQLGEVLESEDVDRVYVSAEELSFRELERACEMVLSHGKQPCLVMPRIFRQSVWKLWEEEWMNLPWEAYLVRNQESLHFLEERDVSLERVVLDYLMYVMNEGSALFWKHQGIREFTLPVELTKKELSELTFLEESELLVYGRLPLMVTAQCMTANIGKCICREGLSGDFYFEDRKGRRYFSRNFCRYCYNVIYQDEAMALREGQWGSLPVKRIRFDFVNETPEEIREIMAGKNSASVNEGHWSLGIE